MAQSAYLTTPPSTDRMPPGIPYIIGNEAAERFSYYGMNSILVVFMTQFMKNASGQPDHLTPEQANVWYHSFVVGLYFLPTLGAILADAFLGKYRTIISLSLVYCLGHLTLALNDTRVGLAVGLGLIALGAGGIKPCVSANVGDQFGARNAHLLATAFSWFYFAINLGSAVSTLLIPWMLQHHGPGWAFGTPGIFMALATLVFWMGRRKFVHVPPGGTEFFREFTSPEGLRAFGNLLTLVPFAAMFWAIWQQNFSSWVVQAEKMDLHFLGIDWLAGQIQTANAVLILVFLPLFSYGVYPAINRIFPLTPLRKFGLGLFATVIAFLIPAWIETRLAVGLKPSIAWQLFAYVVLTAAEIMVSVTHLEFSYAQAPRRLKSLVMSLYLISISLGNAFTAAVNHFIQNPDGTTKLTGANYYLFFAGLMLGTAVIFIFVAERYRGRSYVEQPTREGEN